MTAAPPRAPALGRRLASALYEALIVVAIVIVADLPFTILFGDLTLGWHRYALQAWNVAVVGAYFVLAWTRSGQTLPMKTWRLRVVRWDGAPVGAARAAHRYLLAVLGLAALGAGFAWALFDRDRQFLHDRLAGTAIVDAPPQRTSER
ncbi:MAG TPA: RDD family protein [Usitatibacter sp.]|nr:RDD family protein [Usitatibacter sp.]